MIDPLSFRILEHCKDGFQPITPLINKAASRTKLYNCEKDLCEEGWLQSNGKGAFKTTEQGLQQLRMSIGEAPEGLSVAYPPLARVPTQQHAAVIELAVASVIARQNDLRSDKFPSFLIIGPTLRWKTSLGIFILHMLDLDPDTNIVNVGAEGGKSLWLRKNSQGEISTKRELLNSPLVIFDEAQNAIPEIKRQMRVWSGGRKIVALENEKLAIQATPVLIMNPRSGTTLEERTGLERPEIRRFFICDLSKIPMPDLAIKGEGIIDAAKTYGPLVVSKPKGDCAKFKNELYEFLSCTISETGRELVDLETLLMLATALTGFLEPQKAVKRTLYDAFLIYETLGWTLPDWRMRLTTFPDTVPGEPKTSSSAATETITEEKRIAAFKLLESSANPADLVTKLGCLIKEATELGKGYYDLRDMHPNEQATEFPEKESNHTVEELRRKLEEADLRRKIREVEEPLETDERVKILIETFEDHGRWKQENCSYMRDNYCHCWHWDVKPAFSYQIGDPVLEDEHYFIHPTYARCTACSAFNQQNTPTKEQVEQRLATLERAIKEVRSVSSTVTAMSESLNTMGLYKRQLCWHFQNGYCRNYWWVQKPSNEIMVGKPLLENSRYFVNPSTFICAVCPEYWKKNA